MLEQAVYANTYTNDLTQVCGQIQHHLTFLRILLARVKF